MGKMDITTFDDKQPLVGDGKKALTKKLKDGEAVKTSLYLDPDTHKALKFMALEQSYAANTSTCKRKPVTVNSLIMKAIEQFLDKEQTS